VNYQAGKDPKQKVPASALNDEYLNSLNWNLAIDALRSNDLKSMMAMMNQDTDPNDNMVEWMHPIFFGSKANSEDNPTWQEAMNGPN